MALDLPPPKTLLAHAHWTMDRQKMSKSRGNVADPMEAMRKYGTEAVRYYLMRNAAITDDSGEQISRASTEREIDVSSGISRLVFGAD